MQRNPEKISITMDVPTNRCFGDTKSGVRPGDAFPPYTPDMLEELNKQRALMEIDKLALKLGFYIYITEQDASMYYAPPGVDLESPEVKKFLETL